MRICITRTEKGRYSETFIQNQIDSLSACAEVFTVHAGRLPQRDSEDKLLGPYIFWILHNIAKGVTGKRNNYFGNYGLKKFLLKNKIDVVLANYGIAGAHILPVCKELKIPLVVHFHGFDATRNKILKQYQHAYQILFQGAAREVVVSLEMKSKLLAIGANQNNISLIPCGINLKKFKPGFSKKKHTTFIAVGRFIPKKAPQLTIRAFASVYEKNKNLRLIMIGQKSGLYEECKSLVQELKLEESVLFTGILAPEKIVEHMQQADVFVQHSLTAPDGDMEGTPNSIMEAAACGLPVVSTKHGGIKEVVINGKTGFLVNEHDVNGMADFMWQLIQNPSMANEMGEAGRKHVEENYNLEKQSGKLMNVLEQAHAKNQ